MRISSFCFAALLLTASASEAQTPAHRGWIDVNIGGAMARESTLTTVGSYVYFGEVATETASYDFKRGAEFDFGGGVMVTQSFGLGVSFAGTATKNPVGLTASIPHPLFESSYGADATISADDLQRTEGSVNIQAVFQTDNGPNRFRLVGGPTYFRVKADAVGEVMWDQSFGLFTRTNNIAINGWEGEEVEANAWGFNVGGDYSYFFNNVVGVGAMGRYNFGKVTFSADNGMSIPNEDVDVKVGGFQFGGGLRLRF
jgi:hypothetical protein